MMRLYKPLPQVRPVNRRSVGRTVCRDNAVMVNEWCDGPSEPRRLQRDARLLQIICDEVQWQRRNFPLGSDSFARANIL